MWRETLMILLQRAGKRAAGQGLTEYSLVVSMVSVSVIFAVVVLGAAARQLLTDSGPLW